MWASRGQAQNSADAGALVWRAIVARFRSGDDAARNARDGAGDSARDLRSERQRRQRHRDACRCRVRRPFNTPSGCIKVDISKQDVPTFFARLVNIDDAGRARHRDRDGRRRQLCSTCIKPWIVVDRWTDNSGTGSNTSRLGSGRRVRQARHGRSTPRQDSERRRPGNDVGLELRRSKANGKDWSVGHGRSRSTSEAATAAMCIEAEIAGCPSWVPTVRSVQPRLYP